MVWDSISDSMKSSTRYATVDAIKNTAHGVPIVGTEILVDSSALGGDIEGMTKRNYTPESERATGAGGFQTKVL